MIKISGVSKNYGRVQAIHGIDLDIPGHSTVGILGPSGSGKTTLLRIIAGFESPDEGSVTIDDSVASTPDYIKPPNMRNISAVFQTPALWPNMTVRQNIEYVQATPSDIEDMLEKIGISELADRYPNELSGGEARRASIVRALAADKRYLLLDEPLVNLNPELKEQTHSLIMEEAERRGTGVLYISHDESELGYADKVYRLVEGVLEER